MREAKINRWKDSLVSLGMTVLEVVKVIDESATKIALVIDPVGKLLGTVTDGDIRRGILRSVRLDQPIEKIMNRNPTTASFHTPKEVVIASLRQHSMQPGCGVATFCSFARLNWHETIPWLSLRCCAPLSNFATALISTFIGPASPAYP